MNFPNFRLPKLDPSSFAASVRDGVIAGAVIAVLVFPLTGWLSSNGVAQALPATHIGSLAHSLPSVPRLADFAGESASPDARHLANWVAHARDNSNLDFIIVDKKFARVYVFDAQASLLGVTPVLLGAAPGDHSVAGIGSRPIADIRLEERTTPAGRFLAQRGKNASLEDVVWIDYEAAVSMHRVRATVPAERRLERLESSTVDDNRISWGCINVPVAFFENIVQPVFAQRRAVVYVLPEVKPVREVFGSYDVVPVDPRAVAVGPAAATW